MADAALRFHRLVTALPQKAYQVKHAHEIPIVLRSILSHMLA